MNGLLSAAATYGIVTWTSLTQQNVDFKHSAVSPPGLLTTFTNNGRWCSVVCDFVDLSVFSVSSCTARLTLCRET